MTDATTSAGRGFDTFEEPELRFERKTTLQGVSEKEILQRVKLHPLLFREIYHPRKINSIYFDSPFFRHYLENVEGVAYRRKLRVRWYGETFGLVSSPILEVKQKQNVLGTKFRAKFDSFEFGDKPCMRDLTENVGRSDALPEVKEYFRYLRPTVLCTYFRRYFLSANRHYRLTLDVNIEYWSMSADGIPHQQSKDSGAVIEIKYDIEHDNAPATLFSDAGFRMCKNSKYVNALNRSFA